VAGGDWVKLHRSTLDSSVFDDPWLWKLFSWCLMRANFRPSKWGGVHIPAGSFASGQISGAEELKVSPSRWYRGIQKLVEMGCISVRPNRDFTAITVCNWKTYQQDKVVERIASELPANCQRIASELLANTEEEFQEGKECKEVSPIGDTGSPTVGDEFLDSWNKSPGVVPIRKLTDDRKKSLAARLKDKKWDWREALAKFPLRLFASDPSGWKPDADWFLRPDTVTKILEGKYDWEKRDGTNQQTSQHSRSPGTNPGAQPASRVPVPAGALDKFRVRPQVPGGSSGGDIAGTSQSVAPG